jgi:hypothetical protein
VEHDIDVFVMKLQLLTDDLYSIDISLIFIETSCSIKIPSSVGILKGLAYD